MIKIIVENNLGSFDKLTELGVANFFTFNNEYWGNMSLASNPESIEKYDEIFDILALEHDHFVRIAPEHNDNIQILTSDNLYIYQSVQHHNKEDHEKKYIKITGDAVITKESIPLVITPADCIAAAITGIDKIDGKRFLIFFHSGWTGTMLNIAHKALFMAKAYYDFEFSELDAFVFPFISGEHYLKSKNDHWYELIKDDAGWQDFLFDYKDKVGIDFGNKVLKDLEDIGITNVYSTELETFEANQEAKLFSQTYLKKTKQDETQRFAVGVSL